jgi:hypothetical protein
VHLGFYRSLSTLRVFLCVVFALPTAIGDAIPLRVRWPYLLYYLDDRAHRRHTILSLNNTRELIALPDFNSSMQEGSEEDLFYESEFDSDYDSDSDSGCSEDDFLDEDTLLLVEDKVSLTDDNNVSVLGQSVS